MAKNQQRVLEKYQQRVAASAGEYAAGVQEPKADWLDAYTKSDAKIVAGTQASLQEKRHLKGATRAGSAKWKDRAANVGAGRYAASAPQAATNFGNALSDVLNAGDAAAKAASSLPDATPEQREQRALASMRAIRGYWRQKKGLPK